VHPLDDQHAPRFAVGQVAEMLDVQPAFVRRLDTERVVQPARSDGGQRRYSRADIDHVQRVAEMADEGMTLVGTGALRAFAACGAGELSFRDPTPMAQRLLDLDQEL
jgi:hypothetical protein